MNSTPPTDWLDACLTKLPAARVTVFGDFCLDAYWLIDDGEPEVSVETALGVHRVRTQRYSLGGAGNVAANLVDLGVGQVRAVGLIGDGPQVTLDFLVLNRAGQKLAASGYDRQWVVQLVSRAGGHVRDHLQRSSAHQFLLCRLELAVDFREPLDQTVGLLAIVGVHQHAAQ